MNQNMRQHRTFYLKLYAGTSCSRCINNDVFHLDPNNNTIQDKPEDQEKISF